VPRGTLVQAAGWACRLRGCHPLWLSFPEHSTRPNPAKPCGLLRFRSPLLAEYFLFLRLLRCFSSPAYLVWDYVFTPACVGMPPRGFPHSDISGSNGCTHLLGAFRSVPRPSSALDGQAFTVRPCSFSNRPHRDRVAFAFLCLAMALLKSLRKLVFIPRPGPLNPR
jgi:hypothetical protein